jgi:hypothetical protein
MPEMRISMEQATQMMGQYMRGNNKVRKVPPVLPSVQKASDDNPVFIMNVGPFKQRREMGSKGPVFLKACPEDQEYCICHRLGGIERELYPNDETTMRFIEDDGFAVAQDILGIGISLDARAALTKMGFFISRSEKPTAAELKAAKGHLRQYLEGLIKEMNEAHRAGPKERRDVEAPEHFEAARILKKTKAECPWIEDGGQDVSRETCPNCKGLYDVGTVTHSCGFVLDVKTYNEWIEEGRIQGTVIGKSKKTQ